jgi:hypothetical protein
MREVERPVWLWVSALATLALAVAAVVRLWPAG